MFLSYRNQSVDLLWEVIGWFLYKSNIFPKCFNGFPHTLKASFVQAVILWDRRQILFQLSKFKHID